MKKISLRKLMIYGLSLVLIPMIIVSVVLKYQISSLQSNIAVSLEENASQQLEKDLGGIMNKIKMSHILRQR